MLIVAHDTLDSMYAFLDYFFIIFHSALILFNVTGWMWRSTRRLHLLTTSLTLLSWYGLGIVYGWGYCPCTDWHWEVKRQLGETELPTSYIKYYADQLTGRPWDAQLVNNIVMALGFLTFFLSCWSNWRDTRNLPRNTA